jgi:hypothetical protein
MTEILIEEVWKDNLTKSGGKVIEMLSKNRVLVEFDTGNKEVLYIVNLARGEFKNPMTPSVLGRGFMGKKYHKRSPFQSVWGNMMHRCYASQLTEKYRTYIDVEVDPSWYNFSVFEDWCLKTHPDLDNLKGYQLDKDLKSGILYSENTCVWLPRKLNQFINCEKARPNSETGVIGVSPVYVKGVFKRYEVRGADRFGKRAVIGYTSNLEKGADMFFSFKKNELDFLAKYFYDRNEINEETLNLLLDFNFNRKQEK